MRYLSSISLALIVLMALAMGCVSPAPSSTATPLPYLAFQLDVKIDPKEAATFLLNPSPLGKGGYPQGMVVTIDILPDEGWEVNEWVGPVFNIDGTTAQIEMVSSQSVAVRLKLTTPHTLTPTDTPTPTATPNPKPSATRSGIPYAPPREGADRSGGRNTQVLQPTAMPTLIPWGTPLPPLTELPKWMRQFAPSTPTPTAAPKPVSGTTWRVNDKHHPVARSRGSMHEFLSDGRMGFNSIGGDPLIINPSSWQQNGDRVVWKINDFATYTGKISGDYMSGTGFNIAGAKWTWEAFQVD